MRKGSRLKYLLLTLSVFFLLQQTEAQTLEFSNETVYLTEILKHTSDNVGHDTHFLGWFLNSSSLKINKHHSINVSLMLTHGGEPSANIVGDLQTFSNLEAGFFYGFNETYYQYEKDDFWIKIGQQDINTDFLFSENGLLFTHSSFGIDPVATINMPAPTYPVTALSITTKVKINESFNLLAGIFDGQFAEPKNDFLGINWELNKNDGLIYIIEPEISLFQGRLKQKIGFYHHSGIFQDRFSSAEKRGLSAWYFVSDLNIIQNGDKSINLFVQFDQSTKAVSDLRYYYGVGLKFDNLIKSKQLNELGIGLGHAKLNSDFAMVAIDYDIHNETFIELNYKHQINDWLGIQPYIQWIDINRIVLPDENPIILALRAYLEF